MMSPIAGGPLVGPLLYAMFAVPTCPVEYASSEALEDRLITRSIIATVAAPRLPLYHRIARELETRIFHGIYKPGDAIPSEPELSVEFEVTRPTVRQALRELTTRGVLVSRRGSGTYVLDSARAVRPVNFIGYLEDIVMQPVNMETALGRVGEIMPPERVRARMGLAVGQPVMIIERTRSLQDEPVNHALNYLPIDVGRRIATSELTGTSLFALLQRDAAVDVTEASQTFTATAASASLAKRLRVPVGAALLQSEIVLRSAKRVINLAVEHYRPEHTFFTATLVPPRSAANRSNGSNGSHRPAGSNGLPGSNAARRRRRSVR